MINIIKALNYQMRKSVVTYIALGLGVLMAFFPFFQMGLENLSEINGGLYSKVYLDVMLLLPYIMSCLIGACIMGLDMGDKTINYEILSGHSRSDVFWARIITAFVWVISLCIIVSVVPIAVVTLINGWGNNVEFSDMIPRYLINIAAAARMNAFVVLITSLVRHPVAGGFICYGVINSSLLPVMAIDEFLNQKIYHVFAMCDVYYISIISNMTQVVEDGEKVSKYDLTVDTNFTVVSILIALAVTVVYTVIAYQIFKKRDMK